MSSAEVLRLFGTDGIRGVAGAFPLDPDTVFLIGCSLALNLVHELGRMPRIVVGRDTRKSGLSIERALSAGLRSAGASVESAGVMTTPGIAFLARRAGFDAGVVISASHNPYGDNGIKAFSSSGKKLPDRMERAIEADLAPHSEFRARLASAQDSRGSEPDVADHRAYYRGLYLDYLASEVAGKLSLDGWRIGLDCANGAASGFAPDLLLRLGAAVQVIGAEPDGKNINAGCGSLHLDGLRQLVSSLGLDLGIAFDGDADRALFVDESGEIVDGDATLLILAGYLHSKKRLNGNVVVATVMSNVGLEIALKERGIDLVRAQVGDRNVLEQLLALGATLGGEQSGHIILPGISRAGDGLITAIEVLRAVRESRSPLGELARQMKRYPQVLINVRVRSKPPLESVAGLREEMQNVERQLSGRGRLLVRYSGTENLARVMIEGEDERSVNEAADRIVSIIKREIGESEPSS